MQACPVTVPCQVLVCLCRRFLEQINSLSLVNLSVVGQLQALVEGQRAGRDDLEDAVAAFAAHRIVSYYFPNE